MKDILPELNQINKIKSNLILKKIFSLIWERIKLLLLTYNKRIQKRLKIDIENYRKESQRYRIILENGKGQEFLINSKYLIFEGEYKKGKKHGKGFEYYYNKD